MPAIFRVAELTRALKDVVEGQFPFVWVRGQVSNLARPASGHVYFSLKDEEAVLNVVWFRGSQAGLSLGNGERYDPLTGEVFETGGSAWLNDGAQVLCAGRLTVYAPRGVYQLVAELVQDQGLGRLYLEFEALKATLAARGWFSPERKRPLPVLPRRVALVTAPRGAAIRDFLRVGRERGLGCDIRLHPVLVQGEAAPDQIARALADISAQGWAQVAVVIRGGGSIEDLWAFNTEVVARAVVECAVPVLCGVGHEVDTTIADLVADVRAATPSHAAQLLWPERAALAQRADEADMALGAAFGRFLAAKTRELDSLAKALAWLTPDMRMQKAFERLDGLAARLALAGKALAEGPGRDLAVLAARLATVGAGLARERAPRLDGLASRLAAAGPGLVRGPGTRLEALARRLDLAGGTRVERLSGRLAILQAKLEGLSPERPLERGYVLARKADGTYLRRVDEARPGDGLDLLVSDGTVRTSVLGTSRSHP